MIDNAHIIREFAPATEDGDSFIYTELLDRRRRVGNNSARLLRAFFHRSREEFDRQMPWIRDLCESTKARAYVRIPARSFRAVGATFTRLVVDAALTDNHRGMKTLYGSACGKTNPIAKLWLVDVDVPSEATANYYTRLADEGLLIAVIPSRRAHHYIVKPHRPDAVPCPEGATLMREATTNLYIPDGAA